MTDKDFYDNPENQYAVIMKGGIQINTNAQFELRDVGYSEEEIKTVAEAIAVGLPSWTY